MAEIKLSVNFVRRINISYDVDKVGNEDQWNPVDIIRKHVDTRYLSGDLGTAGRSDTSRGQVKNVLHENIAENTELIGTYTALFV